MKRIITGNERFGRGKGCRSFTSVILSALFIWLSSTSCTLDLVNQPFKSSAKTRMTLISNIPDTAFYYREQLINQSPDANWNSVGQGSEVAVELNVGGRYEIKAKPPGYREKKIKLPEALSQFEFRFYQADRLIDHTQPTVKQNVQLVKTSSNKSQRERRSEPITNDRRGERWALVVGISEYQHESIPPIPFAAEDACAVRDFLVDPNGGGYDSDHVFMLTDYNATARNLRKYLKTAVKKSVQPEDSLFLFFACHGIAIPTGEADSEDGLVKFLIPYNTLPSDIEVDGISMREFERMLAGISCCHIAMVLDTCFSGSARSISYGPSTRNTRISSKFIKQLSEKRGISNREIITACSASELAQDDPETGHGVFTTYFLEGLKQAEDINEDGAISLYEVYFYMDRKVRERSAEIGQRQHPQWIGNRNQSFIIRKK